MAGKYTCQFCKKLQQQFPGLKVEEEMARKEIFQDIIKDKNTIAIADFVEYMGVYKSNLPTTLQNVNLNFEERLAFP